MDKGKIGLDTIVVSVDALIDFGLDAWNRQNAVNIVRCCCPRQILPHSAAAGQALLQKYFDTYSNCSDGKLNVNVRMRLATRRTVCCDGP